MSKPTTTITRRQFLKGTAYVSALSGGSLSGLAFAETAKTRQHAANAGNMTATPGLIAVNLTNQSDNLVALDPHQPVSLEQVNGWVVVKINKAKPNSIEADTGQQISLAAGQQCSFPVNAELVSMPAMTSTNIVITNEYSILDNMVPVTPASVVAA